MRRIKVFAIIALMGSLLLGCGLGKSSSQKMVEKVTKNTEANDSYGANATLQLQMKIGGQQVNCKEQSELTYIKSPFEFNLRNHKTDVKGNTSDSEVYYNNQKSSNIIYTCMDGESWLKQKYSKKAITNINDQYLVPIGLDVFLSNASSFKKVEGESGICLKGTVEKDKILDVLDNSGVLSLLQIGKLQK